LHLLNPSTVLAARGINLDDAQRYTLLSETASAPPMILRTGSFGQNRITLRT
jgi:hypothetical protein